MNKLPKLDTYADVVAWLRNRETRGDTLDLHDDAGPVAAYIARAVWFYETWQEHQKISAEVNAQMVANAGSYWDFPKK